MALDIAEKEDVKIGLTMASLARLLAERSSKKARGAPLGRHERDGGRKNSVDVTMCDNLGTFSCDTSFSGGLGKFYCLASHSE